MRKFAHAENHHTHGKLKMNSVHSPLACTLYKTNRHFYKKHCKWTIDMYRFLLAAVLTTIHLHAAASTIYIPESRPLGSDIYKTNAENIAILSAEKGKTTFKVILDKSESSDNDYLMCRAWYPVYANGKMPFDVYIANAMKTELEESGLYNQESARIIKIQLKEINFSNMISGSWKIQLNVSIDNQAPVLIENNSEFSGHFSAQNACERTANAFMPAVQSLLKKTFTSPEFTTALTK